MKKSLIALAVLAVSGAAFAQSTVTLNGRVDAWVGTLKNTPAGETQTKLDNGGLTGSRWALNGTEDLGGGLKAMFKLENRFNVDDGTSAGQFLGDAYLALAGGFGTVKLGRTYTAFDDTRVLGNSKNVFDSALTPVGDVFKGTVGGIDYTSRAPSGIRYETPNMSGFSASLTYAFRENKTATTSSDDLKALSLKYAAGPVSVAYGYQEEMAGGTTSNKYNHIAGVYDFGVAAVSAGYGKRSGTAVTGDDSGYTLGVTAPVSKALTVSLGYAKEDTDIAGVTTLKSSGWGLGAGYSLSKRTTMYAGYKATDGENAAGTKVNEVRLFAVGVRHDF